MRTTKLAEIFSLHTQQSLFTVVNLSKANLRRHARGKTLTWHGAVPFHGNGTEPSCPVAGKLRVKSWPGAESEPDTTTYISVEVPYMVAAPAPALLNKKAAPWMAARRGFPYVPDVAWPKQGFATCYKDP